MSTPWEVIMAGQITDKELEEIYTFAIQLGKDAGKILMDRAQLRMSGPAEKEEQKFVEKENAVDIVTQTDTGMSNIGSIGPHILCSKAG